MINLEKTVSANSKGVVISYRDSNKHMFTAYANTYVQRIQMEGTTKFQKAEIINYFTPLQKEMYSKVVYGFAAYTNEELNEMSPTVKSKIIVAYTRARRLLNRWKQEIINEQVDSFLINLFPNSPVVKQMVNVKGYDDNLNTDYITFKELGISRQAIAEKLIQFGILPSNFYQLA